MKLCKEMVEAMGGPSSDLFDQFKELCFASFAILRRNARHLIAYISSLCTSAAERVVAVEYVQDRLMLDVGEVDAIQALERLIDESMTALFPKVFETLHKWSQYWRQ